jgi:hypothetical protein
MLRYSFVLMLLALAPACTKKEEGVGSGQHAQVIMRDGGIYSGTITASSAAQVTLAGDDKATHILAMKDVRSINYDDTPAPAAAAPAPAGSAPAAPVSPPPGNVPPPVASAPPAAEPEGAHAEHYHPAETVIQSKTLELPVGTEIRVRCEETIDSAKAAEGQTFAAEVASNVNDASGALVIPRGANAQIVIRSASKGGRFRGTSDLILDLDAVSIGGRSYRLSTVDMVEKGRPGMGANKRTAEYTGGGAAIGAIIGAITGGGKGAAIGAGSGAGAGAVTQAITKGGAIRIPVETVLTFKLDKPLRVVAR